jgi:hypothetical protein
MRKVVWVVSVAASVSIGALLACGSDNNGSNGAGSTTGPSGPSCPGGQLPMTDTTGTDTSPACTSCINSKCNPQSVVSSCNDYLVCACACQPNDTSCASGCSSKRSSGCTQAEANLAACVFGTCASDCLGGLFDGGLTFPDGGLTVPDSSIDLDAFFGFDAGAPAGSCATLATCCATITDSSQKSACNATVELNSDGICQPALAAYEDAGTCR